MQWVDLRVDADLDAAVAHLERLLADDLRQYSLAHTRPVSARGSRNRRPTAFHEVRQHDGELPGDDARAGTHDL
jgi:hypothetical protein